MDAFLRIQLKVRKTNVVNNMFGRFRIKGNNFPRTFPSFTGSLYCRP